MTESSVFMNTIRVFTSLFLLNATLLLALNSRSQTTQAPVSSNEANAMANAPALPRGLSGWAYEYNDAVVKEMTNFNAGPHLKFKYFFPYAGSPEFNTNTREATIYYNPAKTSDRYAEALPPGTLIMPIVDCAARQHQFDGWTDDQYKAAASLVADAIANDPRAAGVQIDIEPFSESQLPFYQYLHQDLNAKGKYTTMFVGPKNEKLLTKIFQSCDIVVISGYDLDDENTGVANYRKLLTGAMARVNKVAMQTHGKYMVGIPASASWGEYEYTVEKGGANRVETGNKQEDYVKTALDVLNKYNNSPAYLGVALWQMSRTGEVDEPEKATKLTKFPNYIRPSVWKILANNLPQ